MRTLLHFLAASAVLATATTSLARDEAPAPAAPPAPIVQVKKAQCYNETANLTVTFKTSESSAEAAIAYPDAKFKEVEQMLAQNSPDFNLQSMNYNINKNQHRRYGNTPETTNAWNITGSFNVQFTSVDSARNALVMLDNADFYPRLNVNKNLNRNCK